MQKKTILLLLFSFIFSFSYSQEEANYYMQALADINFKRYENAEKILNNLISENNRDSKLYIALANCYYKQKKYVKSAELYKLAMKQKNKIASYHIAECYSQLYDADKAVEYLKIYLKSNDKKFKSEIKLNPNFLNIENSKAWINLWKTKHYSGYEKKLSDAKFSISKQDYAEAFDILDLLIIQNRKRHKAHELRGDLLLLTKEYKNAGESYAIASEIKKHNFNYKKKAANAFFLSKKYKKAYKFCISAISENPYDAETYLLKSKIEIKQKNFNNAESSINKFLKYYPDNGEALNLAGKISFKKNEYIDALEKYSSCLKNDTSKPEYFINRADVYTAVSMFDNAEKDLSMALDLNPKQPEVYYKRAIAKLKAHKTREACSDFKKAYNQGYYDASIYLMKYCK